MSPLAACGDDDQPRLDLVFRAEATPRTPVVSDEAMDQTVDVLEQRLEALDANDIEVSRDGTDVIRVSAETRDPNFVHTNLTSNGELRFYDWEANVIPPASARGNAEIPYSRLYDAVLAASERPSECAANRCGAAGPTYYVFGSGRHKPLISGPNPTKAPTSRWDSDQTAPPGDLPLPVNTETIAVPQGTIVVKEELGEGGRPRGGVGLDSEYVLRDRPAMTSEDITEPEQTVEPITKMPAVAFGFTPEGQRAFKTLTHAIAARGRSQAPAGVDSQQAFAYSDHFVIVVGDRILARPVVNFVDDPSGIDGRNGAQVNVASVGEGQDLAAFLEIDQLPLQLIEVAEQRSG